MESLCHVLPYLTPLVIIFLTVPSSQCDCEQTFSILKLLSQGNRSRIDAATLELYLMIDFLTDKSKMKELHPVAKELAAMGLGGDEKEEYSDFNTKELARLNDHYEELKWDDDFLEDND